MDYLTTTELARVWNISSRSIAYYCEAGRIDGAVKKGKAWLIPENAQRPAGKGKGTRDGIENIIGVAENIAVKGALSIRNKIESDDLAYAAYAGDISKQLGISRDTLRYYEKIGLISPHRKGENLYREFDRHDIANFISIDFYKKRGFDLHEIKKLMEHSSHEYSSAALEEKLGEVEQSIYEQQCILKRLKETKEFYEYARTMAGKFEIRDLPVFSVLKSFDDRGDISNYGDGVLSKLKGEDILSHLIRAVYYYRVGYKGSKMCIVKKFTEERKDSNEQFLESGTCLYTAGIADDSFDAKILPKLFKWADEHGFELKGMGYYFFRSMFCVSEEKDETRILLGEKRRQEFYELWIPAERIK